jgi:hypothetical protein
MDLRSRGAIHHDPHAQVCYFSTHTGTGGKHRIFQCLAVCDIVRFLSPRVPHILGSLVQSLVTTSLHGDLLPYLGTNTSISRSPDTQQYHRCFGLWMGNFEHVRPGGCMTVIRTHIRVSVFGMLCIQVWRYYQRYPNDPWSYKVLVSSCCCMFHPMVADALLCSLFFLITLVLRERSACRSSRSGMPISICLYRHLAFTIDQGPGGPSPSINWSYHLVLRRRVRSSRTSPRGAHHSLSLLTGISGTSSYFSNSQFGKSADWQPCHRGAHAHSDFILLGPFV